MKFFNKFIPDAIATTTSRPKAGEEEDLRLVFKISISLLARLEISKLEVFSKICATNLNTYSDKSPRTHGLGEFGTQSTGPNSPTYV